MITLTPTEVRRLRLQAQGVADALPLDPVGVVDRGIAFQGQDLPAVLQAIALRSRSGTSVDDVRAAFDRGELVRGWTMRGTLFVTTPAHHARITARTATIMQKTLPRRREFLGISADDVTRAEQIARAVLARGGATRAEMLAAWEAAGVSTSAQRGYHHIAALASGGVMHWGPFRGRDQLLVATPAAAPAAAGADSADLVSIARRYLSAHGPVQRDELAWWLGLPKTPVRAALASLGDELTSVDVDGVSYLVLATTLEPGIPDEIGVRLVPAFDECYLGYQDRSLLASPATQTAIVPGGNGMFRPVILVDGYVVGTWRRTVRAGEAPVELTEPMTAPMRRRIDAAVAAWPL